MDVLSYLKFQKSGVVLDYLDEFPVEPFDGQMALVSGVVYIYTTLKGMKTWYPLTTEKNYFVHTQGIASTEWTINHDLGTSDFVFFVYDENSNLIQGTYNYIDDYSFKIEFTSARKGRLVLFFAVDALQIEKQYGIHKQTFISTPAQQVFELDSNFSYEYVDIFLNGIKLTDVDYNVVDNVVTLTIPTVEGNVFDITTYGQVNFTDLDALSVDNIAGLQTALDKKVDSDITGISGAIQINNMIKLTQAQYDTIITPDINTFYLIEEV